jgi:hypothetical protein
MEPILEETSLDVALNNAKMNTSQLIQNLPKALEVRESKLYSKFKRHKGNPQRKLQDFYDEIESIYSYVASFTACKKNCSHCCYYPVSISEVEIKFIENGTGIKRRSSQQSFTPVKNNPCPFLQKGSCSIYEYRPFVCRRHVAMTETSHWCETSRCNDAKFSMPSFSEIEKSFNLIRREAESIDVLDIRAVFERREG